MNENSNLNNFIQNKNEKDVRNINSSTNSPFRIKMKSTFNEKEDIDLNLNDVNLYSKQNKKIKNNEINNNNISRISNNNLSINNPTTSNQNANGNTTIELNLNLSSHLKNNDSIISVKKFYFYFSNPFFIFYRILLMKISLNPILVIWLILIILLKNQN